MTAAALHLPPAANIAAVVAAVADVTADNAAATAFVTDACAARYLNARGGSVTKAVKALRSTLDWRAKYKPDEITWDDVKLLNTGRLELMDERDSSGRPVNYFRLRCPLAPGATDDVVLRHWIYYIESTMQYADEHSPGSKIMVIFDMTTLPSTVEPPLTLQIECLRIVQAHYPERMGLAVVCHPPYMFWLIWRAIQPFLDPVTKAKVVFASSNADVRAAVSAHVPPSRLYATLGGDLAEDALDPARTDRLMRELEARRRAGVAAVAAQLAGKDGVSAPGASPRAEIEAKATAEVA